jgi:hypothetical protein
LEFYAPTELLAVGFENPAVAMEHLHDSTYRMVANVFHVREVEWWAIDAGIRMYSDRKPPMGIMEGSWVTGEGYIGVDPFPYFERYSRHHTAPGLIYDWKIQKIELEIAPLVESTEGGRVPDPSRPRWREIEHTEAWKDGSAAHYLLHCALLNNEPRR